MRIFKKSLLLGLLVLASQSVHAKQFTLLIYEKQTSIEKRFHKDKIKSEAYWNEYNQYAGRLQQAGILRGGSAFTNDSIQHVVITKNGKTETKPGSYARSKDTLGGNLVIEVDRLEDALVWARKAPISDGVIIEVREHQPNPTMMMKSQ